MRTPRRAPRRSAGAVAAQKDLTVTQRRAAFSTLVREVVLEGDMAFDGAPLRLLEALARGLADKGKYKRENGRDAVSGLITLLRRSPDYVPQTKDDARAFAGHAWDAAAFQGLIQQGTSDALAVVARAALMSKPAAAKLIDGGASAAAVRACVAGDANGALAAAALVERGAPVSDARPPWRRASRTRATPGPRGRDARRGLRAARPGGRRVAGGPRRGAGRGRIKCRARGPRRGRAPAQVLSGRHSAEADAADVLMERLAACDDPTTLAAFCRAAQRGGRAERLRAGPRGVGAMYRGAGAGSRKVRGRRRRRRRLGRGARGLRARGRRGRAPASKTAAALGAARAAFAATARASERRACRDAVAAFYDDATDAPAKQSEADDDVLVDDAADDRRGAFHAAHCVPGLCGNRTTPSSRCRVDGVGDAPYI